MPPDLPCTNSGQDVSRRQGPAASIALQGSHHSTKHALGRVLAQKRRNRRLECRSGFGGISESRRGRDDQITMRKRLRAPGHDQTAIGDSGKFGDRALNLGRLVDIDRGQFNP
jgi:hypothetical protein